MEGIEGPDDEVGVVVDAGVHDIANRSWEHRKLRA